MAYIIVLNYNCINRAWRAEKRMEKRDDLSMPVHYVTQRKNSLNIQDKCHKYVTRIPIIEDSFSATNHPDLSGFIRK